MATISGHPNLNEENTCIELYDILKKKNEEKRYLYKNHSYFNENNLF